MQQPELERGLAAGIALCAAGSRMATASVYWPRTIASWPSTAGRGGIARRALFRERFGLGRTPARDRAARHRREALRASAGAL